jgi:hypothetical protein
MGCMEVIRLFAMIRYARFILELLNLGKTDKLLDTKAQSQKLKAKRGKLKGES